MAFFHWGRRKRGPNSTFIVVKKPKSNKTETQPFFSFRLNGQLDEKFIIILSFRHNVYAHFRAFITINC